MEEINLNKKMVKIIMLIGDSKSDFFFSHLAKYKVEDKDGKAIGKPGDALLSVTNLSIESLILFGGMLEEKMEDLGLKENIDPIVPLSIIDSVDDSKKKITLKISKEELKTTDNNFKAPEGTIQFIKLKKLPIFSHDNEKIGRVIDIHYRKDGSYRFIVGGSALEEFLEKVRVIPDKDLIVPGSSVTSIGSDIKIKHNKIDLLSTLEEAKEAPKEVSGVDNVRFVPRGMNY